MKAEESKKKKEEESETSSVKTVTKESEPGNNKRSDKEVTNPNPDLTSGFPASGTLPSFAAATTRFRQNVPHPQKREHTSASSMASDSSASPVPFARLQTIATEVCFSGFWCSDLGSFLPKLLLTNEIVYQVCDSTLESATSYVHANTADWNTTIINTILQKLVKETTTEQAQPQYKYIVNSTIIQHAVGGDGGRRGMHAASGAYWNNEKDGMWSFKYEAAEEKGLDVVVGIIWVWIG